MVSTGPQDPAGDPVACYGDAPLTFDATWLGGGEADCPAAPEPTWLACSSFSLQAPGDTRKVGVPGLFVAIHPSASLSIPSDPYVQVRVTGHFDDPAAQTCRETQLADTETLAPWAETIERCRKTFVVTEAMAAPTSSGLASSATAITLHTFAAPLGCDSIGWPDEIKPYTSLTFRIDPGAEDQVRVVSDTGRELVTYWEAGFVPGSATERVIRDPDGQVVAQDGEVVVLHPGWQLHGHFTCMSNPDKLYVALTEPG